ncbi:uncharacterized protein LOC144928781 [Branchiostoma floridae x Branchiostoma belcheri]
MWNNPRQNLYLMISQSLGHAELRDLRNYVSGAGILPAGFVQDADAQQIFTHLEKERKLKPGDLSLLANLLTKLGRNDYAAMAEYIAKDERRDFPADSQVSSQVLVSFESLKHLLTEVKIADYFRSDTYNRLSRHVAESGLTFRAEVPKDGNCLFHAVADQLFRTEGTRTSHVELRRQAVNYLREYPYNVRGDHLRAFVPDQNWDRYLDTMSRDGTWGDHIVLQAMADMFGHDVSIVSSVESENYVTILTPSPGTAARKDPPLLLGHYAENHYASLDGSAPVPLEVELGGPELRALYDRACEEGSTEVYNTRFVLIGKFGNGKTNLCNSLIGADFDPEWKITDSIAIHPCVMTQEQQWIELEGQQDQLPYAAAEWMKKRSKSPALTNLEEASESQPSEPIMPHSAASHEQIVETQSEPTKPHLTASEVLVVETPPENYLKAAKIFQTEDNRSSLTGTRECPQISIWDFGGQEIFYSTQQVFYTHRAIYGMIMNLTKPLDDTVKTTSDSGPPCYCHKEKDYIDYHLESIRMHTRPTRDTEPPVLFIFTHKDKVTEEEEQKFHRTTRAHLNDKVINKHVVTRYFSVDNTTRNPEDPKVAELREFILNLARDQKSYMGEKIPIKWLVLKSKLQDMYKQGKRFCTLEDVIKAVGSPPKGTAPEENAISILTFWHLCGDIIYFPVGNLRNLVILEPQWFVDVCKTIITIPEYQDQYRGDTEDWEWLRKTGELRDRLIENVWRKREDLIGLKQELLDMMDKFDLVLRCHGRSDEESGPKYFVPALLTTVTDEKKLYPSGTTRSQPIFIVFDGKFCPVGLYHRMVVSSMCCHVETPPLG